MQGKKQIWASILASVLLDLGSSRSAPRFPSAEGVLMQLEAAIQVLICANMAKRRCNEVCLK